VKVRPYTKTVDLLFLEEWGYLVRERLTANIAG
jgi:hypothetical protein